MQGDMQNTSSAEIVIQIARHDGHKCQFSDFQVVQGLEEGGSPSLWQQGSDRALIASVDRDLCARNCPENGP